jgi:large subunit ribosomal protein L18
MSNIANARRESRIRRHRRVRKKVHGTAARPRLAVHRSNKHLVVQIIDDDAGRTLVAASTTEAELRGEGGHSVAAASRVGALVAARAKAAGIRPRWVHLSRAHRRSRRGRPSSRSGVLIHE